MGSMPNAFSGWKNAASLTGADSFLGIGFVVSEPPLQPVAELESGFWISTITSALFGLPAWGPKSIVADLEKDELTPTS